MVAHGHRRDSRCVGVEAGLVEDHGLEEKVGGDVAHRVADFFFDRDFECFGHRGLVCCACRPLRDSVVLPYPYPGTSVPGFQFRRFAAGVQFALSLLHG